MPRLSKIARLPHLLREELNGRLEDGEYGHELAAWLNSLPEAQHVLAEHFDSRPINEQNLSDWRYSGFADWRQRQITSQWMHNRIDESAELTSGLPDHFVTTQLAAPFAAVLARLAHRASEEALSNPEQQKIFVALARQLSHLRRDDQSEQRLNLERERLALAMEEGYSLTKAAYAERQERIAALRAFARKRPPAPAPRQPSHSSPPKSFLNSPAETPAQPPAESPGEPPHESIINSLAESSAGSPEEFNSESPVKPALESQADPEIESPSDSADEKNMRIAQKKREAITQSLLLSLEWIRAAQDPGRLDPSLLDQLMEHPSDDLLDDGDASEPDPTDQKSGIMIDNQG